MQTWPRLISHAESAASNAILLRHHLSVLSALSTVRIMSGTTNVGNNVIYAPIAARKGRWIGNSMTNEEESKFEEDLRQWKRDLKEFKKFRGQIGEDDTEFAELNTDEPESISEEIDRHLTRDEFEDYDYWAGCEEERREINEQ